MEDKHMMKAYRRVAAVCELTIEEYLSYKEQGLKRCPRCEQWLLLNDFGIDRKRADGLNCYCLSCARERGNEYYRKNPEALNKRKEYFAAYRKTPKRKETLYTYNNSQKGKNCKSTYIKSAHGKFVKIRGDAKQRNYVFELTERYYTDHLYGRPCFYCGKETKGGVEWIG
jgi:hypothetical protein